MAFFTPVLAGVVQGFSRKVSVSHNVPSGASAFLIPVLCSWLNGQLDPAVLSTHPSLVLISSGSERLICYEAAQ
jgi:hypothetical protein